MEIRRLHSGQAVIWKPRGKRYGQRVMVIAVNLESSKVIVLLASGQCKTVSSASLSPAPKQKAVEAPASG
jgi:hypothetical protein